MTDNNDNLKKLQEKLEELTRKQESFNQEIFALKSELQKLKATETPPTVISETKSVHVETNTPEPSSVRIETEKVQTRPAPVYSAKKPVTSKSDFEKFIGENLTNKIGIVITIIGVAIGAKYAIDHQLISPLTRIILGYLVGLGLLAFAMKLRKNYESFSAVLLSGSMAILYFITFAGYAFFNLYPQGLAFGMMVLITIFTVASALLYNRQIIAHIGLVGAYSIPFLLSNNSGNVFVLFTYMTIINSGILVIAFKKSWNTLNSTAFFSTWIIYCFWMIFSYRQSEHFSTALTFSSIFFLLFYATFLLSKLVKNDDSNSKEIFRITTLVFFNTILSYGIGFGLLSYHETGKNLLGLYTLMHAFIHFIAAILMFKKKGLQTHTLYYVAGLSIAFLTAAIPVQLDGNWVTIIWITEAVVLYWIGRTKSIALYTYFSYPLMVLTLLSLMHDWSGYNNQFYENELQVRTVLNKYFMTSVFVIGGFAFLFQFDRKSKHTPLPEMTKGFPYLLRMFIPFSLILVTYLSLFYEIQNYWSNAFHQSEVFISKNGKELGSSVFNGNILRLGSMWEIIYSLLFFSGLLFVVHKFLVEKKFTIIPMAIVSIALLVFLGPGLMNLSFLRDNYQEQPLSEFYITSSFNLTIRYIAIASALVAMFTMYTFLKKDLFAENIKKVVELYLHTTILWILSSELIQWLDLANSSTTYKLGLTILWGIYAMLLVSLGIWKKRKHLRIGAIAFFGLTLVKLFAYDISHLNTIAKTVVFVSLGILLLIISFLYNKYKHIISDEEVS